mgnify:CR=1 FL=1
MMPYLLHAAALVAASYVFYRLLLGRETFFQLNRWVLLACMVGAFAIPLIEVPQDWSLQDELPFFRQVAPEQAQKRDIATAVSPRDGKAAASLKELRPAANAVPAAPPQITPTAVVSWKPARIAAYLYWCGVLVFGLNFLIQLFVLLFQMYTLPSVKDGAIRIVEWNRDKAVEFYKRAQAIDPEASHASWMENFPWTRLPGVAMPSGVKPLVDMQRLAISNAAEVRTLIGDGNYHGRYQRSDEDMQALWAVAVQETREVIDQGWP